MDAGSNVFFMFCAAPIDEVGGSYSITNCKYKFEPELLKLFYKDNLNSKCKQKWLDCQFFSGSLACSWKTFR